MFQPNQEVLLLASMGDRRAGWVRGVIAESRTPICSHRLPAFLGRDPYAEDCLVCFYVGNQPRYDVEVVLGGKRYVARNVPPGNLRSVR